MSHYGDIGRISSKLANIFLNPVQSGHLIHKAIIASNGAIDHCREKSYNERGRVYWRWNSTSHKKHLVGRASSSVATTTRRVINLSSKLITWNAICTLGRKWKSKLLIWIRNVMRILICEEKLGGCHSCKGSGGGCLQLEAMLGYLALRAGSWV